MDIKKTSKSSTLKEIEHILVVGLGKSGLSCVNYLTKQIEFKKYIFEISVYDKNKTLREQKNLLKNHDIKDFFTGDIKFEFLDKKTHIFLSPGVSPAEVNKFNQKFSVRRQPIRRSTSNCFNFLWIEINRLPSFLSTKHHSLFIKPIKTISQ